MKHHWDALNEAWATKRAQSAKLKKDCDVFLENGGEVEVLEFRRPTVDDIKVRWMQRDEAERASRLGQAIQ